MKLSRIAWILLFGATFAVTSAVAQKVYIGIAPVFDGGGEAFGPVVSEHLTLFTYQDLLDSSTAWPSLLSPGGVYSPLDTSWLVEYVQDRADLRLLLVATLKPVVNPSKERWIIPVDLELLNAQSGDVVASWTVSTEVNSHKTLLDFGQAVIEQGTQGRYQQMRDTYKITPSRDFEKQPLGKATAHLASSIRETLEAKLAGLGAARASPQASLVPATIEGAPASCPINIRITYGYRHSASHSYTLLANGMDQSTNLKDGIANFSAAPGELLLQFSVNDAPYKLEKESLYQMSVLHSCKFGNLIVDLGPGGDAHTHWE
jgi:hypothetical protein